MERRFTLFVSLLLFVPGISSRLSAQNSGGTDTNNFRTIDGTYNNRINPNWGAAGDLLVRLAPVGYEDGISIPTGARWPNPRDVSNILFSQPRLMPDRHRLSDYTWVFGQFIDHDIGLTPDGSEALNIPVREGDAWMDPFRTGSVVIPARRNIYDPSTGTGPNNPRQHPNLITAFIDGSGVYGSDQERANWLRSFEGGKLRVSEGNLLPYNTTTGEFDAPVDHNAPEMDNPVRLTDKVFVAGDARANENPLLTAFHTLFVREHNRICDELIGQHPDWTDEQLYQHARKMVGGKIQAIVYEEWLPTMGVKLPEYRRYDSNVNPQLMNEFTAAAFRVGHTMLNGNLRMLDLNGRPMQSGDLALRDVFFNPVSLVTNGGLEPFLQGMAAQRMQTMDSKVVDDVRNFLFGPPGAGGLDLAAININRGRERGLPDYNTLREALGLRKHVFFAQVNPHMDVFARMMVVYQQLDKLDPWVGMLAEEPLRNSIFGETLYKMLSRQFRNLRDGDRFYYENDPVLTRAEKDAIKATRMREIIVNNTDIRLLQKNVFEATPPGDIPLDGKHNLEVIVQTETGDPVSSVEFSLDGESVAMTDESGMIMLADLPINSKPMIAARKDDHIKNGVTTLDFLLVQKHILGQELLDSPYKIIAADADGSGEISLMDLITIRRIVLDAINELPSGKDPWMFVDGHYTFRNPANPLQENYPAMAMEVEMAQHLDDKPMHIMAIKIGDVDNSALTSGAPITTSARSEKQLQLLANEIELQAGDDYLVQFNLDELNALEGLQLTLKYDRQALELKAIPATGGVLKEENLHVNADRGLIAVSWTSLDVAGQTDGQYLATIAFKAHKAGRLSEYLNLFDAAVPAEAYGKDGSLATLNLGFTKATEAGVTATDFRLFQNEPNPFRSQTFIGFELPGESNVVLSVFDAHGRLLHRDQADFGKGKQGFTINRNQVSAASGLLYYKIESSFGTLTQKMLLLD